VYSLTPYDIDFKHEKNDWCSGIDMLVLLIDNLIDNNFLINIDKLALSFKYWQKNGFKELNDTFCPGIDTNINFIISQSQFIDFPIKSSKKSYKMMGYDACTNGSLIRNSVCGITQDWYQNTISHTIMTHYDTRCISACLVHSYIIRSIWISTKINWNYIYGVCVSIIADGYKKERNLIEFNKYWHLAMNYENLLKKFEETKDDRDSKQTCFLLFLKQLNIGNYELLENQDYVLLGMTLCIAVMIDMNNIINLSNSSNSDYREIDMWYYAAKIKEIISVGGDCSTNASIVGGIIGIYIGYINLPTEWIEKTEHSLWLNTKIMTYNKTLFINL
jgi:ADP-ribosylglycohydrolase